MRLDSVSPAPADGVDAEIDVTKDVVTVSGSKGLLSVMVGIENDVSSKILVVMVVVLNVVVVVGLWLVVLDDSSVVEGDELCSVLVGVFPSDLDLKGAPGGGPPPGANGGLPPSGRSDGAPAGGLPICLSPKSARSSNSNERFNDLLNDL
jgi:hypothetical protein